MKWNATTGENVAWKTPVDGVAVSSPIVWGDRVFVSTAVSSDPKQGIRTGQYGDVEPVTDASKHTWHLIALDKATGKVVWDRVAYEGIPKTKRHPKSSQASATPVTDGTHVIVSFGSEGPLRLRLRRQAAVEEGPRRPERRVVLRSRLRVGHRQLADHLEEHGDRAVRHPARLVPRGVRHGDRQGGVAHRSARRSRRGPRRRSSKSNGKAELVTQATTFTRGYDPMTGKELWRYSGNSEIAIPTPIVGPGFVVITNGYRGVQPIFAIKPGATGDITLKGDETKNEFIAWSTKRGGPYIPTPVIYGDQLYVLQNNGVLAAYKVATGERIYQERLGGTGGSFSASPVAADGKIYCTSEDGDVFVVKAGPKYELLAKNPIGEVIMATPAISDGLLIFRGLKNVYAIKAQ